MRSLVSLFVLLGLALARHESYDGHALYQVSVENKNQIASLNSLQNDLDLDVWSHSLPGRPGLVLVGKDKKQLFEDGLKNLELQWTVEAENVKELLDLEEKLLRKDSRKTFNSISVESPSFDTIHTYEEVDEFLENLAQAYPETVKLVNAGKSFEGRDIKYIKISTTNFEDTSKPIVFMESLLHAREWITLPATLYAIKKLVIDVTESDLLQDIDWIILPIANPDGYVFTHEENRFWRKNRATGYTVNDSCMGVDLNRNFDVLWSTASSSNVCSETFHGRSGFSEPETAVVRDIFAEQNGRIELFLDIHCCGSMVLYGYGTGNLPENALYLHLAGVQMGQAIDDVKFDYNPDYIVGNSALVLYGTSGSAQDYGKLADAPFSYTYELPRYRFGSGLNGFLVDPEFIEQAAFETWQGIKAGARYVRNFSRRNISAK